MNKWIFLFSINCTFWKIKSLKFIILDRNWPFFGWVTAGYNYNLNGTYLRGVIQAIIGFLYYHREGEKFNDSNIHSIIREYHEAARFLKIIDFWFFSIILLSLLSVIKVSLKGINRYQSYWRYHYYYSYFDWNNCWISCY